MARKKKWPVVYQPNTEAWMTTFADLVSLMLTFFILLISMSTMENPDFTVPSPLFSL